MASGLLIVVLLSASCPRAARVETCSHETVCPSVALTIEPFTAEKALVPPPKVEQLGILSAFPKTRLAELIRIHTDQTSGFQYNRVALVAKFSRAVPQSVHPLLGPNHGGTCAIASELLVDEINKLVASTAVMIPGEVPQFFRDSSNGHRPICHAAVLVNGESTYYLLDSTLGIKGVVELPKNGQSVNVTSGYAKKQWTAFVNNSEIHMQDQDGACQAAGSEREGESCYKYLLGKLTNPYDVVTRPDLEFAEILPVEKYNERAETTAAIVIVPKDSKISFKSQETGKKRFIWKDMAECPNETDASAVILADKIEREFLSDADAASVAWGQGEDPCIIRCQLAKIVLAEKHRKLFSSYLGQEPKVEAALAAVDEVALTASLDK